MDQVCVSSNKYIGRKSSLEIKLKNFVKKFKIIWILCVMIIALQNYTINQYARAVLKLTIIQFIDLDSFKNLLQDSCLIYKEIPKRELTKSDCYTCEIIEQVDIIQHPEEILEFYVDLDWPVAYESSIKTNITIKEIALTLLIGDFLPCDYESNLKIDPLRILDVKSKWFMHWRNCDDINGKTIRSLYRPDLFLSISSETWTIMSFNYTTVHYKKINVYYNSRVVVSQISGSFNYQLMPKYLCKEICKPLSGRLETYKTNTLIFNSFIWDFQYLPMNISSEREKASVAIIYYLD
ncbi:Hypothetical protein CINCED_3A011772 [Cinara cedri]|uniref:Uncharacterized protein n=1 Tax=Cinara cedri TaxID=506608 RepID=A0A5E4NB45_9HEMI|nr:Hypothetical protein CINCED_3A011772 [Cinara cedri]